MCPRLAGTPSSWGGLGDPGLLTLPPAVAAVQVPEVPQSMSAVPPGQSAGQGAGGRPPGASRWAPTREQMARGSVETADAFPKSGALFRFSGPLVADVPRARDIGRACRQTSQPRVLGHSGPALGRPGCRVSVRPEARKPRSTFRTQVVPSLEPVGTWRDHTGEQTDM